MKYLRGEGYTVEKTETNQRAPNPAVPGTWKMWKKDLFGFIDIFAVKPGEMPICVQTTTTSNQANRIEKISGLEASKIIVASGHLKIHVHGWGKKGPRGGRKVYKLTITEIGYDLDGMLTTKVLTGGMVEDEEEPPPLLREPSAGDLGVDDGDDW